MLFMLKNKNIFKTRIKIRPDPTRTKLLEKRENRYRKRLSDCRPAVYSPFSPHNLELLFFPNSSNSPPPTLPSDLQAPFTLTTRLLRCYRSLKFLPFVVSFYFFFLVSSFFRFRV